MTEQAGHVNTSATEPKHAEEKGRHMGTTTETVRAPSLASLEPLIEGIQAVSCLNTDEAKTVLYWAIATHGLPKLTTFPILVFKGPSGTGKSTLLDVLGELAYKPSRIDGKVRKPVLRDSLTAHTTALVEEADRVNEDIILSRYATRTSGTTVNRKAPGEWKREHLELFGATALHRRLPFRDPAVLSRSIVVTTHRASVGTYRASDFAGHREAVERLGREVNWEKAAQDEAGRSADTWGPLLAVARHLGDEDWLGHARSQMAKADETLQAGQEEEPTEQAFQALLELAIGDEPDKGEVAERVLLAHVTANVSERGQRLNPWQVGGMLREMGFEVKKSGGKQYVYTGGANKLREVGRQLGIQDEWLEEAEAAD